MAQIQQLSHNSMTQRQAKTARTSRDIESKSKLVYALWAAEQKQRSETFRSPGLYWELRLNESVQSTPSPFLLAECCEFLESIDQTAFGGALATFKNVMLGAVYHDYHSDEAPKDHPRTTADFLQRVPSFVVLQRVQEQAATAEIMHQQKVAQMQSKVDALEQELEQRRVQELRLRKIVDQGGIRVVTTAEVGTMISRESDASAEHKLARREELLRASLRDWHESEMDKVRDDFNLQLSDTMEWRTKYAAASSAILPLQDQIASLEGVIEKLREDNREHVIQADRHKEELAAAQELAALTSSSTGEMAEELLALRTKIKRFESGKLGTAEDMADMTVAAVLDLIVNQVAYKEAAEIELTAAGLSLEMDRARSLSSSRSSNDNNSRTTGCQTDFRPTTAGDSRPPWRAPSPHTQTPPPSRGGQRPGSTGRPGSRGRPPSSHGPPSRGNSFFITDGDDMARPGEGPL